MALVINATAGSSTANSYITLADAETILEEYTTPVTAAWDAAADALKNEALTQATRDIDSLRLSGDKYNTGVLGADDYQPLHFPTKPDVYNSTLQIPENVERATALQAAYILRSGEAALATSDVMASGVGSQGTGRFSEQFKPYTVSRVCHEALSLMGKWLMTSIRIDRG